MGEVRHNGSPEGIAFVNAYHAEVADDRKRKRKWLAELRARGVRAATPDDGWVDRQRNIFSFPGYAPMAARCKAGDVVALGTHRNWREVTITEVIPASGIIDWERYRFAA